jgi:hypothetical protein
MKAMTDQEKKPVRGQSKDDAQFRAVVKRLLDTPPMHKTAKPARGARRPTQKKPRT